MRSFVIICMINFVYSYDNFSPSLSVTDECIAVCKDAELPSLELENYEQLVCQRGCRFFTIIRFNDELNNNTTRKECHLSCEESYIDIKESKICVTGCDLMLKKRQSGMTNFIVITDDEESSDVVLAETDMDMLELLSDPSIKSQVENGFNIDYKIPETNIRTMPIKFTAIVKTNDYSGDWLDCASRNSGIPRWILLSAILSAVLIALWLSFSTDKKSTQDVDIPDDKLILENDDIEKDPSIFEKDPSLLGGEEIMSFTAPPKYCVESEKV